MTKEEKRQYMKGYNARYYLENKARIDANANNYRMKRTYGVSADQYAALLTEQRECCAICGRHQSNFTNKLHIDHNHSNGQVRGLLCHFCNTGLGNFSEDIIRLQNTIDYIKKYNQ